MPRDGDDAFCAEAGDLLAGLPGVQAVTLGGSRAARTATPDSDWDFAIYYRGVGFDPASLRSLGWPGRSSRSAGGAVGSSTVAPGCAQATAASMCTTGISMMSSTASPKRRQGVLASSGCCFTWPESPPTSWPPNWRSVRCSTAAAQARLSCGAAPHRPGPVARGCAGYPSLRPHRPCRPRSPGRYRRGDRYRRLPSAHAVLATRGQWVTNEKSLIDRAGLRAADDILTSLTAEPEHLLNALDQAATFLGVQDLPASHPYPYRYNVLICRRAGVRGPGGVAVRRGPHVPAARRWPTGQPGGGFSRRWGSRSARWNTAPTI